MLRIEELHSFQQADALKDPWDRIVDAAGLDISLGFDFSMALWEALLDKQDIIMLLVKEGDEIVGILPFVITRKKVLGGFPVTSIGLLSNKFCFHNDLICREDTGECFTVIVRYLDEHYPEWDVLEIGNVSEDSKTMSAILGSGYGNIIRCQEEDAPYVALEGGWEKYAQSKTGNFRQNLKRKRKKLSESGEFEEIKIVAPGDPAAVLERIDKIESASWKEGQSITIAQNEKQKRLYEILLSKSLNGAVFITFLRLNGEDVAFMLNMTSAKRCFQMKLGYKDKLKELSPGTVLTEYTVKNLIELGCEEFDLLAGNPRWKQEWATGARRAYNISLYNPRRTYTKVVFSLKKIQAIFKKDATVL